MKSYISVGNVHATPSHTHTHSHLPPLTSLQTTNPHDVLSEQNGRSRAHANKQDQHSGRRKGTSEVTERPLARLPLRGALLQTLEPYRPTPLSLPARWREASRQLQYQRSW